MKGESYIADASTPEDHLNNALFQAAGVSGYLTAGARGSAAVKAACVLRSAEAMVAAFEAEERKNAEVEK